MVGPRRLPQGLEQPSVLQRSLVSRDRRAERTVWQVSTPQADDQFARVELARVSHGRGVYLASAKSGKLFQALECTWLGHFASSATAATAAAATASSSSHH